MDAIIFRKAVGNGKRPKVTAKRATELAEERDLLCRVRRPSLEEFFISGEFFTLTPLATKCVDNRGHRLLKHKTDGWVVPVDSLGRSGEANRSTVESLRLWIATNMSEYVDTDTIAIVVQ